MRPNNLDTILHIQICILLFLAISFASLAEEGMPPDTYSDVTIARIEGKRRLLNVLDAVSRTSRQQDNYQQLINNEAEHERIINGLFLAYQRMDGAAVEAGKTFSWPTQQTNKENLANEIINFVDTIHHARSYRSECFRLKQDHRIAPYIADSKFELEVRNEYLRAPIYFRPPGSERSYAIDPPLEAILNEYRIKYLPFLTDKTDVRDGTPEKGMEYTISLSKPLERNFDLFLRNPGKLQSSFSYNDPEFKKLKDWFNSFSTDRTYIKSDINLADDAVRNGFAGMLLSSGVFSPEIIHAANYRPDLAKLFNEAAWHRLQALPLAEQFELYSDLSKIENPQENGLLQNWSKLTFAKRKAAETLVDTDRRFSQYGWFHAVDKIMRLGPDSIKIEIESAITKKNSILLSTLLNSLNARLELDKRLASNQEYISISEYLNQVFPRVSQVLKENPNPDLFSSIVAISQTAGQRIALSKFLQLFDPSQIKSSRDELIKQIGGDVDDLNVYAKQIIQRFTDPDSADSSLRALVDLEGPEKKFGILDGVKLFEQSVKHNRTFLLSKEGQKSLEAFEEFFSNQSLELQDAIREWDNQLSQSISRSERFGLKIDGIILKTKLSGDWEKGLSAISDLDVSDFDENDQQTAQSKLDYAYQSISTIAYESENQRAYTHSAFRGFISEIVTKKFEEIEANPKQLDLINKLKKASPEIEKLRSATNELANPKISTEFLKQHRLAVETKILNAVKESPERILDAQNISNTKTSISEFDEKSK